MRTIVATRKDITNLDAGNNNFVINFAGAGADLTGCEIALVSMYLYYSWYNISAALGNNKYTLTMDSLAVDQAGTPLVNAPLSFNLVVTIPDGQYEISDLNAFLQQFCIDNNAYLIDTATQEYVYFWQFQINPTRYKVQLNTFAFPDGGLPAGYTAPPNGFLNGVQATDATGASVTIGATGAFPVVFRAPGVIFTSKFDQIMGFTTPSTIFPSTVAEAFPDGAASYLSSVAPQIQPNPVAFLNCNGIDNAYTSPATFLYSIPAKTAVGDLLIIEPPNMNWAKLRAGIYNQLVLSITSANFAPLELNDPNIIITLVIRGIEDLHPDIGKSGTNEVVHADQYQKYARHPSNTSLKKGKDSQLTSAATYFGNSVPH